MKSQLFAVAMVMGVLFCFAGCCFALVDWVTDYKTGVYQREYFEAFYETAAILFYAFLGFRFMNKRMNSLL